MRCGTAGKLDVGAPSGKRPVKRLIALAVCVLFMAAASLSAAFMITCAHHEHDHNGPDESCAVCAHLASAGDLLKSMSAAVAGAALVFWGLPAILSLPKPLGSHADFYTLVRLKVKLNN
jgi:hypothetical protein